MRELKTVLGQASAAATTHAILESLMFREMPMRHIDIKEAHIDTFGWIFDSEKSTFKTWLSSESGAFWISGKAGSGKSTLMKFLCDHPETEKILQEWARSQNKTLVTASFYFWNSGLPMQRKQEGLLQSLLFQTLRKCPQLIPNILPQRWAGDEYYHRHPDPWTRKELIQALTAMLIQDKNKVSTRFCFFIDGLDEYEGDHRELIAVLKSFQESGIVKLCISSRPWTEFKDVYGAQRDRFLVLQDLTRGDMERFVRGMLENDERFIQLAKREKRAQEFMLEIVGKAEGVFLWVFLVVRSLLRGLDKHDSISMLEQRLERLPSDLETYFQHILDSIEDVYHDHAARMFQLATRAEDLPLMAFWYLPEERSNPELALKRAIEPLSSADAEAFQEEATYRVVISWKFSRGKMTLL